MPVTTQEVASTPIPSTVWKLGWISFFADVSSEMVYPLIPLFLTGALKAPVAVLGLTEGIAESIVSIMKGITGWRSDQVRRRLPFVRWGYGLSALGKPLLGLANVWPMVLLARSIDRVGKGVRTTARDALVADVVPKGDLGRAFGIHRGLDTAGALVGVLLAFALVSWMPGKFRVIFLIAGIPAIVSVALTFMLREQPPKPTAGAATVLPTKLRDLPRDYWSALGLTVLFGIANSSDTFLLLRAKQTGLDDGAVIAAYALYNLTYMLLVYPASLLSDRRGRWLPLGWGWLLYAVVYAGFAIALSSLWLWPLFALYGVYIGLTKGVTSALVADHSPASMRGTAMGFFYMANGFSTLLASVAAGLMWDRFGPSSAFWLGSLVALIAWVSIPLARKVL